MSGRIYDPYKGGVPICGKCGNKCLTSAETNFNGVYCRKCKEYPHNHILDNQHPDWIGYLEWSKQFQGKLVAFSDTGFDKYKEINGITY